jgi:preprotein translocase subunit SecG
MSFIAGVLTFILAVNCLLLILLVLVQLPKKDAGAGMAFGGGTADALFGSGSGNTLTKITKYTAVAFLGLALLLSWMQDASRADTTGAEFNKLTEQKQQQQQQIPVEKPLPAAQTKPAGATPAPGGLLSATIPLSSSNAVITTTPPAPAATNAAKPVK